MNTEEDLKKFVNMFVHKEFIADKIENYKKIIDKIYSLFDENKLGYKDGAAISLLILSDTAVSSNIDKSVICEAFDLLYNQMIKD